MKPFVDQIGNIRALFASPFQPPIDCRGVIDCDWTRYSGTETFRPSLEYVAAGLCVYGLAQALLKARYEGPRAALPGMTQCVVGAFLVWTIPQLSPEHFSYLLLPILLPVFLAPFAAAIWLVFKLSKKVVGIKRIADGEGL